MVISDSNKKKLYLLIIVGVLLIAAIGVSFAFFIASIVNNDKSEVLVQTEQVNKIIFTESAPLQLLATEDNFGENDGSLSASGTSSAKYIADAGTKTNYDINIDITSNTFVYTQNATTPEIILSITGPEGEIVSIPGLSYVTPTDVLTGNVVKGFDITNKTGSFNIDTAVEIIADGSSAGVVHDWDVTVTFLNLATNQKDNEGKNLEATLNLE